MGALSWGQGSNTAQEWGLERSTPLHAKMAGRLAGGFFTKFADLRHTNQKRSNQEPVRAHQGARGTTRCIPNGVQSNFGCERSASQK